MGSPEARKRRLHRQRGLPATLTTSQWQMIVAAYGGACAYCGALPPHPLRQEHVIPVSRGGGYTAENIVPACEACDGYKQNRTPAEAGMTLRTPRFDDWGDNTDGGITPTKSHSAALHSPPLAGQKAMRDCIMSQGLLVAGVRLHRNRPVAAALERLALAGHMEYLGELLWRLKTYGVRGLLAHLRWDVRECGASAVRGWLAQDVYIASGMLGARLLGVCGMTWAVYGIVCYISYHRRELIAANTGLIDGWKALDHECHPDFWQKWDALVEQATKGKA